MTLLNHHTCGVDLVCEEPFCEVISVSLHKYVITQDGDSALMMAVREGRTEVVPLLLEAGANIHIQNKVRGCMVLKSLWNTYQSQAFKTNLSHTRVICA